MTDPTKGSLLQQWNQQVDVAVATAYGQAGYITEDGDPDTEALALALLPRVIAAVAHQQADRATVCIARRTLMEIAFPKITGPEHWADVDNPPLAEAVYKRLDGHCWALTAIKPSGPLQGRLNSEHKLVLLRTKTNPGRLDAVYVTRDKQCIQEDATKQMKAAQVKDALRDAAFTAMLIERVPEHGKAWDAELSSGMRTAMKIAQAKSKGALEAATLFDADEAGE